MVFFKKLDLEETSRELLKMILGEEKKKEWWRRWRMHLQIKRGNIGCDIRAYLFRNIGFAKQKLL